MVDTITPVARRIPSRSSDGLHESVVHGVFGDVLIRQSNSRASDGTSTRPPHHRIGLHHGADLSPDRTIQRRRATAQIGVHRRGGPRRRLAQPVHRGHCRRLRDVPTAVPDADRVGREELRRRAGAGGILEGVCGPHVLDLQDQAGPQVERRRTADRQGRRVHLQPHHQRDVREDQLRHLRQQHHQGRSDPTTPR